MSNEIYIRKSKLKHNDIKMTESPGCNLHLSAGSMQPGDEHRFPSDVKSR